MIAMPDQRPMRIGVPVFGCDGGRSGIGQYAIHLIRELAKLPGEHEIEVIGHPEEIGTFLPDCERVRGVPVPGAPRAPVANILWHLVRLPSLCRRRKYDVLFLPAGNRRLPWRAPCPTIGTVHDVSSLHVPGKYGLARSVYIKRVLPQLIARLDLVVTVSESSRADIARVSGIVAGDIRVISNGVDLDHFRPDGAARARARMATKLGFGEPYLLYVARIEHPGKNHIRLIEAFEMLKAQTSTPHRLVLAGPDWDRAREVHAAALSSSVATDIVFTGFIDDDELPELYRAADGFVFPSLYEGFGIPVLEAMASGVPVACGHVSSLPEVAGRAARYFDPTEPADIAAGMVALVTDSELRVNLATSGLGRCQRFTWRAAAERTLDAIRKAARCGPAWPALEGRH